MKISPIVWIAIAAGAFLILKAKGGDTGNAAKRDYLKSLKPGDSTWATVMSNANDYEIADIYLMATQYSDNKPMPADLEARLLTIGQKYNIFKS